MKYSPKQVQSAIDKVKKQLISKWKRKGGYENFGQKELRKFEDKFEDMSDYSNDMKLIRKSVMAFADWASEYDGTNESITEAKTGKEIARKLNLKYHFPKSITDKVKKLKIVTAADLKRILPNSELKDGDIKMILHEPGKNESVNESKFSKSQIEHLRKGYESIQKINPSSPTYKKLTDMLDGLSTDKLKQLSTAKIKWVSMLARNRVQRGKHESVNEATVEPKIIRDLRWIVTKKQNKKVTDPISKKKMTVDLMSASAVVQVYDAISKPNKEKFVAKPLPQMVGIAYKLVKIK